MCVCVFFLLSTFLYILEESLKNGCKAMYNESAVTEFREKFITDLLDKLSDRGTGSLKKPDLVAFIKKTKDDFEKPIFYQGKVNLLVVY